MEHRNHRVPVSEREGSVSGEQTPPTSCDRPQSRRGVDEMIDVMTQCGKTAEATEMSTDANS